MKAAHLLLLCVAYASSAVPQAVASEFQILPAVAERLLIHKVDPVFRNPPMPVKVTGTVVVAIEIARNGRVDFAKVVSGPRILRQPVLDAVRQYRFKPYQLNGKPVAVESTVSVTCSNE